MKQRHALVVGMKLGAYLIMAVSCPIGNDQMRERTMVAYPLRRALKDRERKLAKIDLAIRELKDEIRRTNSTPSSEQLETLSSNEENCCSCFAMRVSLRHRTRRIGVCLRQSCLT